jgi:hypothetical protein
MRSCVTSGDGLLAAQQGCELFEALGQAWAGAAEEIFFEDRYSALADSGRVLPAGTRQDSFDAGSFRAPHQHATTTSGWRAMASSGETRTLSTSRSLYTFWPPAISSRSVSILMDGKSAVPV